jgi:alkanesulfonate monooxygenase SsuD/methylene tetrahydromethanopterin reductase-like flavin-dependent oxidoreductase (luciferase family)
MRYGLSLPNGGVCGDARVLAELGVLAEESGWDGVFVEDYIVHQSDGAVPTCDPWIALAAMAVGTKRVRLGTSVTPLNRRRPWKVAREAVALDQLSNGRFILGVGSGDVGEAGFSRVNEVRDAKERAQILDEALDIILGLWTGQPFSYEGRHFQVHEMTFLPTPVTGAASTSSMRQESSQTGRPTRCAGSRRSSKSIKVRNNERAPMRSSWAVAAAPTTENRIAR